MCRRLHRLLYSPPLLHKIGLTAELSSLDAARSLLGWLTARCAGRTQRLQLCLQLKGLSDQYQPDDDCSEVASHLSAAMAACSAAGGLSELDVELQGSDWTTLHVGSWAAALRGLTRLRFAASCELRLSGRLGGLTSLQTLELAGKPVCVAGFASLPKTLTCLMLGSNVDQDGDTASATMPPQVGWGSHAPLHQSDGAAEVSLRCPKQHMPMFAPACCDLPSHSTSILPSALLWPTAPACSPCRLEF